MMVADSLRQEAPVVPLAALTVGHATVERLPVTVSELFLYPVTVDGLLRVVRIALAPIVS